MRLLHDLALLYLSMAQSAEGTVSNAEREAVTDNLHRHYPHLDRAEMQNDVLEALTEHAAPNDLRAAARAAISVLNEHLSTPQKSAVLKDLVRIARADGIVLDTERSMLDTVAETWGVALPSETVEAQRLAAESSEGGWSALHHLAYIYLVLAHAPDHEFSENERHLVLKKLHAWDPSLDDRQIRTVLDRAIERYARGHDADMLAVSVEAVRADLPTAQRQAALHDLVQIANADDVFLDSEEDLLNALTAAWDVEAYTTGRPDKKGGAARSDSAFAH